jgi:hypothetical protein
MAVSFFDNKTVIPDDRMIAGALAETYPLWDELQNHVQENYPNITGEWKHYGKASGWSYKLISKKRNLLFFVPLNGCFRIRIVLGEKAVACVETATLPDEIKEAIRAATPYTEGRSIDIDINRYEQLEDVKCLLKIKFDN